MDEDVQLIPREDDSQGTPDEPTRAEVAQADAAARTGKGKKDTKANKADPYAKERKRFLEAQAQKQQEIQAVQAARAERESRLRESKQRRHEQARKLQQRTRKGQPVLKNQLDHILAKLQKDR